MIPRVRTMFGAYDLYAKLLPGIVFFVGLLSLLPNLPNLGESQSTLTVVTIVVISVLVFGFMVGQALHSLAVSIEEHLFYAGLFIYTSQFLPFLRIEFWENHQLSTSLTSTSENHQKIFIILTLPIRILINTITHLYCWVVKQLMGLLVPHRREFLNILTDQFEAQQEADPLYNWFKITCRDHLRNFEMDLTERYEDIYSFVMSYMQFMDSGRARQFQAMAAFCRGMWVTLLVFSLLYTSMIFVNFEPIFGYPPVAQSLINQHGWVIPVSLLLGSIVFMSSTKQYKRHFVEYIVVDFYNLEEMFETSLGP